MPVLGCECAFEPAEEVLLVPEPAALPDARTVAAHDDRRAQQRHAVSPGDSQSRVGGHGDVLEAELTVVEADEFAIRVLTNVENQDAQAARAEPLRRPLQGGRLRFPSTIALKFCCMV